MTLALSNRLSETRPHFERAVSLDPESTPLRQTYGRVLLGVGEVREAVKQLREALRLDPGLPGVHRDLAVALQQLGWTDEARYHANEANRRP